jgi:predicted TIM-barrel fold metal-dependent hydrolase
MKLIAIEEHFLTREVKNAWKKTAGDDPTNKLHFGEIENRLEDIGLSRLQLMDETGIDVQVLSLTSPSLHNLGNESINLAIQTNDYVSEIIKKNPDRFQGFAALPMFAPTEAAKELERSVKKLDLKGAMLCGRTREKNLDHKDFWEVFECAETLGVPLFIHPQIPQKTVRDIYYSGFDELTDLAFSTFGLGWHYEAGIQFVRLVLAKVFDRFPNLQIILGHWGEVILFYTERLASLNRATKLQKPFIDYVRQNLYVTPSGMFSQNYLQRSVEIIGADRLLFSSDYPYQYRQGREARNFLEATELSISDKEKFAFANWEKLIGTK